MLEDARLVTRGTLGGDHDLIAHIREGKADFLFAVGIGVGCIKIADAAVVCRLQELYGVILVAALYRQAAHGGLGDDEAGFSECKCFHAVFPLFIFVIV